MADERTVNDVRVYQDSAGFYREQPVSQGASDAATAMLPSPDFTDAQKAMARLPLPFRNVIRDPFVPAIAATAKTTAYPQAFLDMMAAKGCSSFRIINPNSCAVRFRGATGADDLIKEGEGRLLGPWQTEVFSTQNPTFLSVMPVVRPGLPIPADLAPVELNYGIGG
ncbi:hypothetical protein GCM10011380_00580 [Sphingomonas metalli]|uniref:Uncharacterized protein n=1 Tax=Sphingomonas metalli TaxID=1779358 RepID=A0A916SS57_9SPHN|nr:hypothetical protein [Sphingomonas metalli]GGB15049.1 hypothetical protein GCM10011380_00580 [Sphingomonas metalli]